MAKRCKGDSLAGKMFPDDMISEILFLLPVKSLLRFKSVSKSWYALITNPNFTKSHLRVAMAKPEGHQTLINRRDKWHDTLHIALLDLDSRKVVSDLNFRGEIPSLRGSFVVGSACGIVCVCVIQYFDSFVPFPLFAFKEVNTYLWNPATKQSKLIPPYTIARDGDNYVSIGFGYDPIGDDFKVVRLSTASAEVFSVNRNAWRKVDSYNPVDIPYINVFDCSVSGYVFSARLCGIIGFDLNREVLNCDIGFPDTSYFDARVTDYGGRVAVITWSDKEKNEGSYIVKLWTLDDDACLRGSGVKASWTSKLNVDMDSVLDFVHGYFSVDVLIGDPWALHHSQSVEERYLKRFDYLSNIYKYTESLVSIKGSKRVRWNGNWNDDEGEAEYEFEYKYEDFYPDEDEFEDNYDYQDLHEDEDA